MSTKEDAQMIPVSLYGIVSKRLIEIVLGAEKTESIPTSLAKSILYLWQRDQLENEVGIEKLLEAAMLVEPEKTLAFFQEVGLQELVISLKEIFS
jgi:hypothetical protein